jgi:uncharacterized protein YciU (UPF0263 family)
MSNDIVEEAQEGYEDAKQGHEAIKDALVNEHGSDTTTVALGGDVSIEVETSPGMGKVREIQQLAGELDEDADPTEIMDNFKSWCEGVATLIVDDDFDAELLMGIAQEDIQAFSEVLSRILEAMDLDDMEVDEDALQSFP